MCVCESVCVCARACGCGCGCGCTCVGVGVGVCAKRLCIFLPNFHTQNQSVDIQTTPIVPNITAVVSDDATKPAATNGGMIITDLVRNRIYSVPHTSTVSVRWVYVCVVTTYGSCCCLFS